MQESSVAFNLAELEQRERAARAAYWLSAVLGLGLVGCAALYLGALRPAMESTRVLAAEAQALAAERAHTLDELRSALRQAAPLAVGAQAVAPAPAPPPAASAAPSRDRIRLKVQVRPTPAGAAADELRDLDLNSDDPFDLEEHPSPRGQTRRR